MRTFWFLLLCICTTLTASTVYLAPHPALNLRDLSEDPDSIHDDLVASVLLLKRRLEREGFTVKFTSNGDDFVVENPAELTVVISFMQRSPSFIRNLRRIPRMKRWMVVLFSPLEDNELYQEQLDSLFGKVFTPSDELVAQYSWEKIYLPHRFLRASPPLPAFSEKKLCVLMAPYEVREEALSLSGLRRTLAGHFLQEAPSDLDIYGTGWASFSPLWKGESIDMVNTLKNYKFCLCVEPVRKVKGYISGCVLDCFLSKCVPVYFGPSNIEDYLPVGSFINMRTFRDPLPFQSPGQLVEFLQNIDETTYQAYLNAGATFMTSAGGQKFTAATFVQKFVDAVQELEAIVHPIPIVPPSIIPRKP